VADMFMAVDEGVDDLDYLVENALVSLGKGRQNEFDMDDMVEIVNFINTLREEEMQRVQGVDVLSRKMVQTRQSHENSRL